MRGTERTAVQDEAFLYIKTRSTAECKMHAVTRRNPNKMQSERGRSIETYILA